MIGRYRSYENIHSKGWTTRKITRRWNESLRETYVRVNGQDGRHCSLRLRGERKVGRKHPPLKSTWKRKTSKNERGRRKGKAEVRKRKTKRVFESSGKWENGWKEIGKIGTWVLD